MVKVVSFSCVAFLICFGFCSCRNGEQSNNERGGGRVHNANSVNTYDVRVLCLDTPLAKGDEKIECNFISDCIKLSHDTIAPNYYIEIGQKKYRLDSYLYHQRSIGFWYDIFINKGCSCSFVLFCGEKENGRYQYTVLNLSEDLLKTSSYYEVQSQENKSEKQQHNTSLSHHKQNNDTIAVIRGINYSAVADSFFSKDNAFPDLYSSQQINFLLRNGTWVSQPTNEEENLIMEHFCSIRTVQ
jgi:hypothetical protein